MACLLIAGTIILTEKIKGKNKEKKDKKRQAYEDRYNELQDEHKRGQLVHTRTGDSNTTSSTEKTALDEKYTERNNSQTSIHSRLSSDGPAQWIAETNKHRAMSETKKMTWWLFHYQMYKPCMNTQAIDSLY